MNPPLKYYWIVEYRDGTKFSQFDSETGKENQWKEVRQEDVIRVSWRQFSYGMSKRINIPTKWVLFPSQHTLNYVSEDEIFICRRNHIDFSGARGESGRRTEYILGKNKEEIIKL
jgi:hypothetical protein